MGVVYVQDYFYFYSVLFSPASAQCFTHLDAGTGVLQLLDDSLGFVVELHQRLDVILQLILTRRRRNFVTQRSSSSCRRGGADLFLLADVCERRHLAGLVGSKDFTQRAGEEATGEAVDVHPLGVVDGASERRIRRRRRGHRAESVKERQH